MSNKTIHPLRSCVFEKAPISIFENSSEAAIRVANEIVTILKECESEERPCVLGLATGSTPVSVYAELVRMHREEGLSFKNVTTFNLDEYYGLEPEHEQSYRWFMRHHLFDHIDIDPARTHVPAGKVSKDEVDGYCAQYEEQILNAGGLDFQLLGIGRTGHIGFNEPGSPKHSLTRLVTLDSLTRRDASGDFGGISNTPKYAITMGVKSILNARRVVLLAWGQHKAEIVREAVECDANSRVTASFLQEHDNALFVMDQAAAGALTRVRTPWLVGSLEDQNLEWDQSMTRRAILWLAETCNKAILKLTDDDYNNNGLQDLLSIHGSAHEVNLVGFYQLQHTITGWPGGRNPEKTRSDASPVRPLKASSAKLYPKRVLILSPHPDDDVISMGGTFCRLADHGHEVHVAYEVSGAGAVSDEAVWRMLCFAGESGLSVGANQAEINELCAGYEKTGRFAADDRIKGWKALMRRHEAIAGARVCGVERNRLHFMDLPLYNAAPRNRKYSQADIDAMVKLLSDIQPHLIYAAGDLEDPHGTHRLCLRVLHGALKQINDAGDSWLNEAEIWLYRGAWAEWPLDEIDMAVPLSPQEVLRRRLAIFRHETQKDQALFLGQDRREFWQRTEDRSSRLAKTYNALGLAEYEAIEAFKRYNPKDFIENAQL